MIKELQSAKLGMQLLVAIVIVVQFIVSYTVNRHHSSLQTICIGIGRCFEVGGWASNKHHIL